MTPHTAWSLRAEAAAPPLDTTLRSSLVSSSPAHLSLDGTSPRLCRDACYLCPSPQPRRGPGGGLC